MSTVTDCPHCEFTTGPGWESDDGCPNCGMCDSTVPAEDERDKDYARLMAELHASDDIEVAHVQADKLLCSLLLDLGFRLTVDAYREVEKWYA